MHSVKASVHSDSFVVVSLIEFFESFLKLVKDAQATGLPAGFHLPEELISFGGAGNCRILTLRILFDAPLFCGIPAGINLVPEGDVGLGDDTNRTQKTNNHSHQ